MALRYEEFGFVIADNRADRPLVELGEKVDLEAWLQLLGVLSMCLQTSSRLPVALDDRQRTELRVFIDEQSTPDVWRMVDPQRSGPVIRAAESSITSLQQKIAESREDLAFFDRLR